MRPRLIPRQQRLAVDLMHAHVLLLHPGDLHSGKEDARSKRKALIKLVEALIETVEKQVKQVDEIKAQSTPSK
jgi:hypothetical protein